jgi:hypothetical protein
MKDMNSEYPWFTDGDLILHLPGKSNDFRNKVFNLVEKNTDFDTGTVKNKEGILKNIDEDWRVQSHLFHHYLKAGWNVKCRDIVEYKALL